MTKAQLREAIKREARVKTASNLDALIDDIVADILRDYCNKARYHELLMENVPLTLVAAQQAYSLPVDYMNMESVRYGRGASPTVFRELVPQKPVVRQTYSEGYPRYYRFVADQKISLFPYGAILATDQLVIDYYIDPATVYTDDADAFPVPRLESAVKKDAIARVQRFNSAVPEAQMMDADGASSFNAADSAS